LVKSFALEPEARRRFGGLNEEVQDSQRRIFRRVSLFSALLNLLNHASLVILLAYGGWMVIQGQLALGTGFVVFASLLQQLSNQIGTLSQVVTSVQESLSGAERVFQILDAPSDVASPATPLKSGRMQGAVRFDQVSFGFDERRPALQDLSFSVAPGQLVAVVGETGAGKSALLGLIPRHYDPEQGVVRIDGVDLRQWHLADLRRQVGVVFQEPFIFSTSIAENIRFGRAEASDEDVRRAAQMARAHEFIMDTEQGYDTVLEEAGNNLSGGQRQRIALARALVADPAILLLDDPTSALDPETEHEIFAAMDQAMASRTTFVVAHRLSTLQRADRVLLLVEGRLADSGTHAELMRRNAQYRAAAEMQLDTGETEGISTPARATELEGEAA
jgi:ATP-binding cassette subfamily B protein